MTERQVEAMERDDCRRQRTAAGRTLRYALAFAAVVAAYLCYRGVTVWIGPGLPPFITFYPAIMLVALLGGFGPGLTATVLSCLLAAYWIIPPFGSFSVASPISQLGLVIFAGMGLFISVVSELYRRARDKGAAYDREVALRETRREKEFLANLLEHSSQPFAVGYPDGRLGRFNAAFELLTGYGAEELPSLDWTTALTAPESLEAEQQKLEELGRTRRPVRYEKTYIRKDGSRLPVELLVHLADDNQGRQIYYSFLTDLTERKRLEEERERIQNRIEAERSLLKAVILNAPVGISFFRGSDLTFQVVNPTYQAIAPEKEMLGKSLQEVWPELYSELEPIFRGVLRTGTPFEAADAKYLIRRSPEEPAEPRYFSWFLSRVLIPGEEGWGLLNTANETTESVKAREALVTQREFLHTMLSSIGDAVMAADVSGNVTLLNPAACRLTGWNEAEAIGRSAREVFRTVNERTREDSGNAIDLVLRERRSLPLSNHTALVSRGGLEVPIEESGAPIRDNTGQVIGAVLVFRDVSEKRRAEETLRESEERLRLAQQAGGVGTFDWNIRTGVNTWTPELERMYGLAPGEFAQTQTSWESMLHPEDRAEAVAQVDEALRTGAPGGAEFRVIRPDGGIRWLAGQWQAFKDASGMLLRLAGTNIDITERKQAEEELLRSRERMSLVIRAADLGTWDWDLSRGALEWSPRCYELFGLTSDNEITYERFLATVHADDRERIEQAVRTALEQREEYDVEMRVVWPDHSVHWISARGKARYDASGRATRMTGVTMEITERKQAEEKLRASAQRFRMIVENAATGIVIEDGAGRIEQCNSAFCSLLGYTEEEVRSLNVAALIHPEDREFNLALIRRLEQGELPYFEIESRYVRKDGQPIPVIKYVSVLPGAADGPAHLVALVTDITARKRVEEEIRTLNTQLEVRVRERTAQLEVANKELEAFAYSVSHDLRAPLRGIDGWSLALEEDYASRLDERAHGYVARVRSEAQRMGRLIDDMLQLSRVTRSEMERSAVDLSAVARAIANRLREAEPDREIEFIIGPGLNGNGDMRLLEIALTNLLSNAVKFTKPRRTARIEVGRTEGDGERAFYVRDNGVGFDMSFAGTLFGAFQRLHKASEFPGTGIGLATVQRIIRRHGGRVWAEAQPDRGATFYFTLSES